MVCSLKKVETKISWHAAAILASDKNLFLVLLMGSFDGLFCWLILSIYVISMMEINGICIQGLTRVRHGVLSTTLYKNKMECKYYSTKFLLHIVIIRSTIVILLWKVGFSSWCSLFNLDSRISMIAVCLHSFWNSFYWCIGLKKYLV